MVFKFMYISVLSVLGIFILACISPGDKSVPLEIFPTVQAETTQIDQPNLDDVFKDLVPKNGDCGLLIAFDTDLSKDAESYAQFYDFTEKESEKQPTNQTIYLTRIVDKVELSAKLNFIASPQKHNFLYLGQSRYFEPKPRRRNQYFSEFEREDSTTKLFGFDYTRIWKTTRQADIEGEKKQVLRATKLMIDAEFRKSKEKERMQNISDYEKVGYIADGFYIADGYWSRIIGGAAFFEAHEQSKIVPLSSKKFPGRLRDWYSQKQVFEIFKKTFDDDYRFGEDSKYNDMDAFWKQWSDALKSKYEDVPTFSLERIQGRTHLKGLVLVPGNNYRSFLAASDFGDAPKALIKYDNPPLDFGKLKSIYPTLIDAFVSPNQNTVFLLTDNEIIGIDVKSRSELFRFIHRVGFNKVIMVEWATNGFVNKWKKELLSN